MPVKTPNPVVVRQEILEADTWSVVGVFIGLPVSGKPPTIHMQIAAGKTQPDGSITWLDFPQHEIKDEVDENGDPIPGGQHFTDLASRAPSGGTIYEAIRDLAYPYAQERGWIPAEAT